MIAAVAAGFALTLLLTINPSQAAPKAYETSSSQYRALLQAFLEDVNKDVWLAKPATASHRTVKFVFEESKGSKGTATASQCNTAGVVTQGGTKATFDIASMCHDNDECTETMKEMLHLAAAMKSPGKQLGGVYAKCSDLKGIYPQVPVVVDKCSAPDN